MTLMLKTLSHGNIEAGYFSAYTGMVRLGKYAFETKYFCNFVQYLAEHSNEQGSILAYDLDKFQQEFDASIMEFMRIVTESQNRPNELRQSYVNGKLIKSQGGLSKEVEADLQHKLEMLAVQISEDSNSITIGKYKIPAVHFGIMAHYVANGGWLGWINENPDFAESTLDKIKGSENKLFAEYQNWLNKN